MPSMPPSPPSRAIVCFPWIQVRQLVAAPHHHDEIVAVVCYDDVEGSHDVETSPSSKGKDPIAISSGDE